MVVCVWGGGEPGKGGEGVGAWVCRFLVVAVFFVCVSGVAIGDRDSVLRKGVRYRCGCSVG